MPEHVGGLIQLLATVISIAGALVASMLFIYKAGQREAIIRNGFVRREDCHKHIDGTKEIIGVLDEKTDKIATAIGRIEGHLGITVQ